MVRALARQRRDAAVHPGDCKLLDDRIANLAYGAVAVTGVLLVWIGPYSFTTPWVLSSIVLFIAVGSIGFLLYTPTLRRQVDLATAGQTATDEFQQLSVCGAVLGPLLGVLVVTIVFVMVVQLALWG